MSEETPLRRDAGTVSGHDPEPPSFADAVRFVYRRRVRIASQFVVLGCVGMLLVGLWLFTHPRPAVGRLILTFRGIEKGEYPSGRKFSTEDFRAPDVLRAALADAGISSSRVDLNELSANVNATPIIPPDVIARWKKQDREGTRREEFVPNEIELRVGLKKLSTHEELRLFDAIVNRYRAHVKFEQKAALRFISDWSRGGYTELVRDYDYWEIPFILGQNVDILTKALKGLIEESKDYRDPTAQLSFRDLEKDLAIWSTTRLEMLRALTYKGLLVKNRAVALVTVQYRLEDLAIQTRAKSEETAEALRLLEAVGKPQPVVATQFSGREGIPIVDSSVMERIVKSDYMTPLIKRISELQEEKKDLEAKKWRLEQDAKMLPQAREVPPEQLPKEYKAVVDVLSKELSQIIRNYNLLLDRYLTETVTSLVGIKSGPAVTWDVSLALLIFSVVVVCSILALFTVVAEHVIVSAIQRTS
jgi:hypothetical protein